MKTEECDNHLMTAHSPPEYRRVSPLAKPKEETLATPFLSPISPDLDIVTTTNQQTELIVCDR